MNLATESDIAAGIPVRNAWYLLLYAWDMAAWLPDWCAATEEAPHLLGLLSRLLGRSVEQLLRRQLRRSFMQSTAMVRGVRGRINFDVSLKKLAFHRGRACCTFPELLTDTLPNRIIRSTLLRLIGEPSLMALGTQPGEDLRQRLRMLSRRMEGVSVIPVRSLDFARLQLGRNDRDYAVPLAICRLIHDLRIPEETAGDKMLGALLRDEMKFHKLFERFVRNFYKLHLSQCHVQSEKLEWFDELCNPYVPAMYTDASIVEKASPFRRLVLDTKYSVSTLAQNQYGSSKFKSENLYQLYTYLRTQEHLSESHRSASGILLYPTNGFDLLESMSVQGHKITVATVDLAAPWPRIEQRLLSITTTVQ